MDTYIAQIQWLSYDQGGRKSLPSGNTYYPIIITEGNVFDPQKECWSVIVSDMQTIDTLKTISKIQYLSEKAPKNLFPKTKFMLYEGPKLVATGIIVDEGVENKERTR